METTFRSRVEEIISEIVKAVMPIIHEKRMIEIEVNYTKCTIKVIDDDWSSVFVELGNQEHEFKSLPLQTMALIADAILINGI